MLATIMRNANHRRQAAAVHLLLLSAPAPIPPAAVCSCPLRAPGALSSASAQWGDNARGAWRGSIQFFVDKIVVGQWEAKARYWQRLMAKDTVEVSLN